MLRKDLVIGLDSSTTACKVVIVDADGHLISCARSPVAILKPRPSWHEQDANVWWSAARRVLREATAQVDLRRLAALCITAQRETFVVCDEDCSPLSNALLWLDERCRDLLPEIDRRYSSRRIHEESGKPLSANLSLGKIFWLHEQRRELLDQNARVLDVHSFLTHRLTGQVATSWGCADPMGVFDMRKNCWNASLLEAIGLRVEQLPQLFPVGAFVAEVTPEAADQTGLPAAVPVIAGLGDGQSAGLGACAVSPGDAYLNLGTAIVSGTFSDRYLVDQAFRTMIGGIPGSFVTETVQLGGAYTISWFVENFAGPGQNQTRMDARLEEILEAEAAELAPGSEGLTLVPYWNGTMNPYWDAAASGIVVGWRGIHRRAHFYRAILEGTAFEQRLHTEGVEKALGRSVDRFIAVGGGARSSLWCQIIADVTGKPVFLARATEASAFGAAIIAAAGAGLHPDILTAAQKMAKVSPSPFTPDSERQTLYSRLYQDVYRNLFPALQTHLQKSAEVLANRPPAQFEPRR